jgi:hypothetical protein
MRLTLYLALLLCVLLTGCSPAVRVAKYYKRYTHGYRKQQRKPMHLLPRTPLD